MTNFGAADSPAAAQAEAEPRPLSVAADEQAAAPALDPTTPAGILQSAIAGAAAMLDGDWGEPRTLATGTRLWRKGFEGFPVDAVRVAGTVPGFDPQTLAVVLTNSEFKHAFGLRLKQPELIVQTSIEALDAPAVSSCSDGYAGGDVRYQVADFPWPLGNRDSCYVGGCVVGAAPSDRIFVEHWLAHAKAPPKRKLVRAKHIAVNRLTKAGADTSMELALKFDLGGDIPDFVVDKIVEDVSDSFGAIAQYLSGDGAQFLKELRAAKGCDKPPAAAAASAAAVAAAAAEVVDVEETRDEREAREARDANRGVLLRGEALTAAARASREKRRNGEETLRLAQEDRLRRGAGVPLFGEATPEKPPPSPQKMTVDKRSSNIFETPGKEGEAIADAGDKDYTPTKSGKVAIAGEIGFLADEMVQDDLVNACTKCDEEFSIFKRRHHCRHCGNVFCDDCSDFRCDLASRKVTSEFLTLSGVPDDGPDSHSLVAAARVCKRCEQMVRGRRMMETWLANKARVRFEWWARRVERTVTIRHQIATLNTFRQRRRVASVLFQWREWAFDVGRRAMEARAKIRVLEAALREGKLDAQKVREAAEATEAAARAEEERALMCEKQTVTMMFR